jgi:DNA repair exonuclease SbcCD ATPase subunit
MDETTGTAQDSVPVEEQASAGDAGSTSGQDASTHTDEEIQKAVSDALAAKGRDVKKLSAWEARLKAQEESIKAAKAGIEEFKRRRDEAELEEARTDSGKLIEFQRKKALDVREAELKKQREELNRQRMEHDAEVKSAKETLTEIKLWQIGAKYGINPATLKGLNLPSLEDVETVAKQIGRIAPQSSESAKSFNPDSGMTSGTLRTPTPEQFEKLPTSEKRKFLPK